MRINQAPSFFFLHHPVLASLDGVRGGQCDTAPDGRATTTTTFTPLNSRRRRRRRLPWHGGVQPPSAPPFKVRPDITWRALRPTAVLVVAEDAYPRHLDCHYRNSSVSSSSSTDRSIQKLSCTILVTFFMQVLFRLDFYALFAYLLIPDADVRFFLLRYKTFRSM